MGGGRLDICFVFWGSVSSRRRGEEDEGRTSHDPFLFGSGSRRWRGVFGMSRGRKDEVTIERGSLACFFDAEV